MWSILNALRSHDDHFNAEVNKIALNKNRTSKVVVGGPGIGHNAISDKQDQQDAQHIEDAEVARQLQLRFGEMQSGIYAKLVENVEIGFIGKIGLKGRSYRKEIHRTNF